MSDDLTTPSTDTVTISRTQLAEMIAAEVAKHQAAPATDASGLKALGESIKEAISAGQPPKKVSIGEYIRRGGTPCHPLSYKDTPKFTRTYFQNGRFIEHATTSDAEVRLLNQLTHSGRYINRMVEVIVSEDGSDQIVNIRFSNSTDKVLELKGYVKNFADMLTQIVAVQGVERQEREGQQERTEQRRQLSFGSQNKAVQKARENAGVV